MSLGAGMLQRLFGPLNTPIDDWAGRRVWIVGASSGIGEALALELARRGARLALSARSADKLRAVCAACDAARVPANTISPAPTGLSPELAGDHSLALALDLTDADAFARARDALLAHWGGIDLVVFNAGT